MEGSPQKRARTSKAAREATDCGSVREVFNLPQNSLVNFTGCLLDMSDLRYVETSKGRKPVVGLFIGDPDGVVSIAAWEQPAVLLSTQAGRALDSSKGTAFPKITVKAVLVDLQQGTGGAAKLVATGTSSVQVVSTMDLKIVPHSSMVSENFGEIVEKRGTCSPYVVHLRAQLTKLDELTWSKNNSAMRRGVLTDADGRSLHVTFMAQNAEDMQAEVGDIVTIFYSHIKAMDNRDNAEQDGTLMVWAYQDSYVLKLGKVEPVRSADVFL